MTGRGRPRLQSTRLAGHSLPHEGKLPDGNGGWLKEGPARCQCGETSPVMPNTHSRQRWHRDHKVKIEKENQAMLRGMGLYR